MKLQVTGAGIWSPGIENWQQFVQLVNGQIELNKSNATAPAADIIPPREKRRVPIISRIAIEAGTQACRMAGIEAASAATVFASCMADTEVTDYMCRALTTAEKMLSPTRFHNSVHNATSGYWSIFTGGRHSSGFTCAFRDSFAAGLIEAGTLTCTENRPTLLICYDIKNANPMHSACPVDASLAYAIALQPADSQAVGRLLEVSLDKAVSERLLAKDPVLMKAGLANPCADGLAVLAALGSSAATSLYYKAGSDSCLQLDIAAGKSFSS